MKSNNKHNDGQDQVQSKKIAVVLLNLGAPDNDDISSIRTFLFNLFNDNAIIKLPQPFRFAIAKFMAYSRGEEVQKNYKLMGSGSPLLKNTTAQAKALEQRLNGLETMISKDQLDSTTNYNDIISDISPLQNSQNQESDHNDQENDSSQESKERSSYNYSYKVFIAMRYWHPFAQETIEKLAKYDPDEIVLLPLYPHFSSTTTGSSIKNWHKSLKKSKNPLVKSKLRHVPQHIIRQYYDHKKFIAAHCDIIKRTIDDRLKGDNNYRLLFSAHSLPKIIAKYDPYESHIKATVEAIVDILKPDDYSLCYQSKVGPLPWLEPSTEDAINLAIQDQTHVVIVPISFVSEHSETLIELDRDYRFLMAESPVPDLEYVRVETLSLHPLFIECLADLTRDIVKYEKFVTK